MPEQPVILGEEALCRHMDQLPFVQLRVSSKQRVHRAGIASQQQHCLCRLKGMGACEEAQDISVLALQTWTPQSAAIQLHWNQELTV